MKKIILILLSISFISANLFAQSETAQSETVQPKDTTMEYRRSSLYSILLTHPSEEYSFEILQEYNSMDLPDKFDDHTLSIRSISTDAKKTSAKDIQAFLNDNAVGRRMVARWFNRDKSTGFFNTELVNERGNYDASIVDVDIAKGTFRGNSAFGDGESLIQNTFVLVHDVTYIDKEEGARKAGGIMRFIGAAANVVADVTGNEAVGSIADLTESVAILGASISDLIAGFTVKTTSHLYQLEWNDGTTTLFYENYWCDESMKPELIQSRKEKFENEKGLFNLTHIGSYDARSQKTVLRGVRDSEDVIKKVCTRSLDKNIAMLQREYDVFKVNTPILVVDGKNIIVPIGMKEEIDVNSKFEVLEVSQDGNGVTKYKRVGVVKPVKDMIWDNRYMAVEEEAIGATLKGTTFHAVSGNKFYPGMLIKEIK